jgi:hypothetical protein
MLTAVVVFFRTIGLICSGHRAVALENVALRQQLAALKRSVGRPQLRRRDRRLSHRGVPGSRRPASSVRTARRLIWRSRVLGRTRPTGRWMAPATSGRPSATTARNSCNCPCVQERVVTIALAVQEARKSLSAHFGEGHPATTRGSLKETERRLPRLTP